MKRPQGRPRREIDEAKLARARKLWLSGKVGLTSAARIVGIDRDGLRVRWPEFAAWTAAKNEAARHRAARKRGLKR
jgi:hypothetical protein